MKKTLIVAMCCIVALMAACKKKPVEPTPEPEPVNYAEQYVGNYLGSFTLTINTTNNVAVTNMSFPIDGITMSVTEGEEINSITATVTVDNESHQTSGVTTSEKADFESIHLKIDKPDQNYMFNLDLKLEGNKTSNDTLNLVGTFYGNGRFEFMEQIYNWDEVSGTVHGILEKQ